MDMDISMDIHAKSVGMAMDMDGKFHIHSNPAYWRKTWASLIRPPVYSSYSKLFVGNGRFMSLLR